MVKISSDASNFGWRGMPSFEIGDYWVGDTRSLPIVVKEVLTFVNTLQAGKTLVTNAPVEAHTDNLIFLRFGGKDGARGAGLPESFENTGSRALWKARGDGVCGKHGVTAAGKKHNPKLLFLLLLLFVLQCRRWP